jgi:hypothetical protein
MRQYRRFTYQMLKQIAQQYTSRMELKRADLYAYRLLMSSGKADEYCAHMTYGLQRKIRDEEIAAIAKRYAKRIEFYKQDNPAYSAACRRGILDQVCAHMPKMKNRKIEIVKTGRDTFDLEYAA